MKNGINIEWCPFSPPTPREKKFTEIVIINNERLSVYQVYFEKKLCMPTFRLSAVFFFRAKD